MANKALCSIPDCGKVQSARGWCEHHYGRWRRYGDPVSNRQRPLEPGQRKCSVFECDRHAVSSTLCSLHQDRLRRYGRLDRKRPTREEIKAFIEAATVSATDECIFWPYQKDAAGYGKINKAGKRGYEFAHRVVCRAKLGPAPRDKPFACHGCGRPACINPRHLRWGSAQDNSDDAKQHGTTAKGARNSLAVLTDEQAREIYLSSESQVALAKQYGVTRNVIHLIFYRKTWRHATNELPDRMPGKKGRRANGSLA